MATGIVKWYNDAKGVGFITRDEDGADIYVSHSNIVSEGYRTLLEGSKVNFDIEEGSRGIEARNVTHLE